MSTTPTDPAYLHAGSEFRVGTGRWWGDAVIGADAIYLLQGAPARGRKVMAVFEVLADRLLPARTLPAGPVDDVPASVRADPGWPVRSSAHVGAVIVPKDEVPFLLHERGKLETRFAFRGVEVAIPHGRFGAARVKAFAEAHGWPMFWDGTPLNVPGRSPQQLRSESRSPPFGRPTVSYAAITAGFVLGAAPMLLELAPNLDRDLVSTLWLTSWLTGAAVLLFGWVALRRGL